MDGIVSKLIEETALDGLEGSTLAMLWERASTICSCEMDVDIKRTLWSFLRTRPELLFYQVVPFEGSTPTTTIPAGKPKKDKKAEVTLSKTGIIVHKERTQLSPSDLSDDPSEYDNNTFRIVAGERSRSFALGVHGTPHAVHESLYCILERSAFYRHRGILQSDLGRELNMDARSCFHYVKRLFTFGLISREQSEVAYTQIIHLKRFADELREKREMEEDMADENSSVSGYSGFSVSTKGAGPLSAAEEPSEPIVISGKDAPDDKYFILDHIYNLIKKSSSGCLTGNEIRKSLGMSLKLSTNRRWRSVRRSMTRSGRFEERMIFQKATKRIAACYFLKDMNSIAPGGDEAGEGSDGEDAAAAAAPGSSSAASSSGVVGVESRSGLVWEVPMPAQIFRKIEAAGPEGITHPDLWRSMALDTKISNIVVHDLISEYGVKSVAEKITKQTTYRLIGPSHVEGGSDAPEANLFSASNPQTPAARNRLVLRDVQSFTIPMTSIATPYHAARQASDLSESFPEFSSLPGASSSSSSSSSFLSLPSPAPAPTPISSEDIISAASRAGAAAAAAMATTPLDSFSSNAMDISSSSSGDAAASMQSPAPSFLLFGPSSSSSSSFPSNLNVDISSLLSTGISSASPANLLSSSSPAPYKSIEGSTISGDLLGVKIVDGDSTNWGSTAEELTTPTSHRAVVLTKQFAERVRGLMNLLKERPILMLVDLPELLTAPGEKLLDRKTAKRVINFLATQHAARMITISLPQMSGKHRMIVMVVRGDIAISDPIFQKEIMLIKSTLSGQSHISSSKRKKLLAAAGSISIEPSQSAEASSSAAAAAAAAASSQASGSGDLAAASSAAASASQPSSSLSSTVPPTNRSLSKRGRSNFLSMYANMMFVAIRSGYRVPLIQRARALHIHIGRMLAEIMERKRASSDPSANEPPAMISLAVTDILWTMPVKDVVQCIGVLSEVPNLAAYVESGVTIAQLPASTRGVILASKKAQRMLRLKAVLAILRKMGLVRFTEDEQENANEGGITFTLVEAATSFTAPFVNPESGSSTYSLLSDQQASIFWRDLEAWCSPLLLDDARQMNMPVEDALIVAAPELRMRSNWSEVANLTKHSLRVLHTHYTSQPAPTAEECRLLAKSLRLTVESVILYFYRNREAYNMETAPDRVADFSLFDDKPSSVQRRRPASSRYPRGDKRSDLSASSSEYSGDDTGSEDSGSGESGNEAEATPRAKAPRAASTRGRGGRGGARGGRGGARATPTPRKRSLAQTIQSPSPSDASDSSESDSSSSSSSSSEFDSSSSSNGSSASSGDEKSKDEGAAKRGSGRVPKPKKPLESDKGMRLHNYSSSGQSVLQLHKIRKSKPTGLDENGNPLPTPFKRPRLSTPSDSNINKSAAAAAAADDRHDPSSTAESRFLDAARRGERRLGSIRSRSRKQRISDASADDDEELDDKKKRRQRINWRASHDLHLVATMVENLVANTGSDLDWEAVSRFMTTIDPQLTAGILLRQWHQLLKTGWAKQAYEQAANKYLVEKMQKYELASSEEAKARALEFTAEERNDMFLLIEKCRVEFSSIEYINNTLAPQPDVVAEDFYIASRESRNLGGKGTIEIRPDEVVVFTDYQALIADCIKVILMTPDADYSVTAAWHLLRQYESRAVNETFAKMKKQGLVRKVRGNHPTGTVAPEAVGRVRGYDLSTRFHTLCKPHMIFDSSFLNSKQRVAQITQQYSGASAAASSSAEMVVDSMIPGAELASIFECAVLGKASVEPRIPELQDSAEQAELENRSRGGVAKHLQAMADEGAGDDAEFVRPWSIIVRQAADEDSDQEWSESLLPPLFQSLPSAAAAASSSSSSSASVLPSSSTPVPSVQSLISQGFEVEMNIETEQEPVAKQQQQQQSSSVPATPAKPAASGMVSSSSSSASPSVSAGGIAPSSSSSSSSSSALETAPPDYSGIGFEEMGSGNIQLYPILSGQSVKTALEQCIEEIELNPSATAATGVTADLVRFTFAQIDAAGPNGLKPSELLQTLLSVPAFVTASSSCSASSAAAAAPSSQSGVSNALLSVSEYHAGFASLFQAESLMQSICDRLMSHYVIIRGTGYAENPWISRHMSVPHLLPSFKVETVANSPAAEAASLLSSSSLLKEEESSPARGAANAMEISSSTEPSPAKPDAAASDSPSAARRRIEDSFPASADIPKHQESAAPVNAQESSAMAVDSEAPAPPPSSAPVAPQPQRTRLVYQSNTQATSIRPWIKLNGQVNEAVLRDLRLVVAEHVILNPGITNDILHRQISSLNPSSITEILDMLIKDGIIQLSLISVPSRSVHVRLFDSDADDTMVVQKSYFPMVDAISKILKI